ncbi:cell wall-active antibiotics response protein LiaF [Shouchella lonarensis]|uniref:Lia operon protein LiaF n=1 Tax=Shouchella lonarensis TaxID=1464122 RepID=A0A1G6JU68_9BACI|nr:cell wall-active antibiotics response protein LiaF [Shouchella lonarensis]SDC22264.1 lia operon protein LiaF [Shouchella lonarensis]
MRTKSFLGMLFLIIGLISFFMLIGGSTARLVAPVLFCGLGFYFYQGGSKFLSLLFMLIGVAMFVDQLFSISFFGLLFAFVCLYYGLQLVKQTETDRSSHRWMRWRKREVEEGDVTVIPSTSAGVLKPAQLITTRDMRRHFISDIRYTGAAFDLHDLTIWNGIGDIRMDLAKAIIPAGETVLVLQVGLGSITLYVPDDVAVSVQAGSVVGDVTIFQERQSGFNQQVSMRSQDYETSTRRVKVVAATLVGDVKVKEL